MWVRSYRALTLLKHIDGGPWLVTLALIKCFLDRSNLHELSFGTLECSPLVCRIWVVRGVAHVRLLQVSKLLLGFRDQHDQRQTLHLAPDSHIAIQCTLDPIITATGLNGMFCEP